MDGVQRCPTDGRRWRPGRPLALVIKLRNCTDNESVCLRVKALGDTRRGRRPCWRCQNRSEAVPLQTDSGLSRFCSCVSPLTRWINLNSTRHPKKSNPCQLIRLPWKNETPKKQESLCLGTEKEQRKMSRFTSGELVHLNPLGGKWSC